MRMQHLGIRPYEPLVKWGYQKIKTGALSTVLGTIKDVGTCRDLFLPSTMAFGDLLAARGFIYIPKTEIHRFFVFCIHFSLGL